MNPSFGNRRRFLGVTAAAGVGSWLTPLLFGDDSPAERSGRPRVTTPRATSGDTASEPNWDERLTITVGQKEGDLIGSSHKVLQAAVDYVARLGGAQLFVRMRAAPP